MLSFGSDPELMLTKDGKYFSAIGIVQGNPLERISEKGHQFYWDNVMAECAIKPGKDKEEVIYNFRECFSIYSKMVSPYKLTIQASQNYPSQELKTIESRIASCLPDWCAYQVNVCKNEKTAQIIEETRFRTAGGHIHLGGQWKGLQENNYELILTVRLLDLFLGIPSMYMDHDPTSIKRRKIYGMAGRFRPKPYGLEYRSLSNFWLASPKLVELVYDICLFTLKYIEENDNKTCVYQVDKEMYQEGKDLSEAFFCVGYSEKELRKVLDKGKDFTSFYKYVTEYFLPKKLVKRIESIKPNYDFYKEWKL
jgi:hypothetical protein